MGWTAGSPSTVVLSDPDGLQGMSAAQVLKVLFER